jgi:O-antigen/teichoic acid export membrane protein
MILPISKIKALLERSAPVSLASAFLARGATAGLIFVLIALAARELDVGSFGVFSMLYSLAGMLALAAAGGQQILLMRSWSEYGADRDAARLKGALIFSGIVLTVGVVLCSLVLFSALVVWQPQAVAFAVTTSMAGIAIVIGTSHLIRAAVGVEAGDGVASLATLTMPIVYLLGCALARQHASLVILFYMFPLGAVFAAAIHVYLFKTQIGDRFPDFWQVRPHYEFGTWRRRSVKLWLYNGLEAINQFLDVLLLGVLLNPTIAGAYFVLTRLANVFIIASGAVGLYASRHIPRLYYEGDLNRLGHYLNVVAVGCAVLIPAGLLLVWLLGPFVLSVLEPHYVQYAPLLLLLCLGTAAILGAGASGMVLTFTGHEGWIVIVLAATVLARMVGFMVFVPSFQMLGATLVTASSFIVMSAAMSYLSRRLTGIDGSVVRLLSRFAVPRTVSVG